MHKIWKKLNKVGSVVLRDEFVDSEIRELVSVSVQCTIAQQGRRSLQEQIWNGASRQASVEYDASQMFLLDEDS